MDFDEAVEKMIKLIEGCDFETATRPEYETYIQSDAWKAIGRHWRQSDKEARFGFRRCCREDDQAH